VLCTLGDLLLDVIVRLDGPIAEDTDTYGRTRVGAGGQAANVAAWTAALDRPARFIGKRARDPTGQLVAAELRRHGVQLAGPEVDAGTGVVVSIVTTKGKRTMLTDRGVASQFHPHELDSAWVEDCEWLHLPGYSLVRTPIRVTAMAAAERAPHVSIDLSSTAAIEAAGVRAFSGLLSALSVDVVFANEDEAALIGELDVDTFVVKRGARGCLVRTRDGEREYPAEPADVVDTTGAGDAFAAGFLAGGPELALRTAAKCVSQMGAMP
jgi:sugar/nucleoside kinase (ribokinase family)